MDPEEIRSEFSKMQINQKTELVIRKAKVEIQAMVFRKIRNSVLKFQKS